MVDGPGFDRYPSDTSSSVCGEDRGCSPRDPGMCAGVLPVVLTRRGRGLGWSWSRLTCRVIMRLATGHMVRKLTCESPRILRNEILQIGFVLTLQEHFRSLMSVVVPNYRPDAQPTYLRVCLSQLPGVQDVAGCRPAAGQRDSARSSGDHGARGPPCRPREQLWRPGRPHRLQPHRRGRSSRDEV